jgi:hypothetical protein
LYDYAVRCIITHKVEWAYKNDIGKDRF